MLTSIVATSRSERSSIKQALAKVSDRFGITVTGQPFTAVRIVTATSSGFLPGFQAFVGVRFRIGSKIIEERVDVLSLLLSVVACQTRVS